MLCIVMFKHMIYSDTAYYLAKFVTVNSLDHLDLPHSLAAVSLQNVLDWLTKSGNSIYQRECNTVND